MHNLDKIIKLITKMAVVESDFRIDTDHHKIINHAMEQQGINKVIRILQQINDNNEDIRLLLESL